MHRQSIYVDSPSLVVVTLAGAVATILATSLIYVGPVIGLPLIDAPSLIGGVFTGHGVAAFWVGYVVFFLVGWLVLPIALKLVWNALPGDDVSFRGAVVKGLLLGAATWVVAGLALWLLSELNQLEGLRTLGAFGIGYGWSGVVALLLGNLAYGAALGITAAMGQGLSPIDALGWVSHGAGFEA